MRTHLSRTLCILAAALALLSAACFFVQGGFGAGHGSLDRVIYILAIPWALIDWPAFLMASDFVWLILLPFGLNIATIALFTAVCRALRRDSSRP